MKASNHALSFANELDKEMGLKSFTINGVEMQRTGQQRKSIEKYCDLVAKAMNDSGESVQTVFTAPVEITHQNIKEYMFKVVMTALYPDKTSTTELDSDQVTKVYDNMHRIVAERYGINVEWPSVESLYNESQQRFNAPIDKGE